MISLRVLSAIDWNEFFEQHSQVERTLRDDPAGVYAQQDFATRDRYRRIVEEIARGADVDEQAVVRRVLELARAGRGDGPARGHVGYYLVDRGRAALQAGFRPKLEWSTRAVDGGAGASPADVLRLDPRRARPAAGRPGRGGRRGGGVGRGARRAGSGRCCCRSSELAVGLVNHLLTLLMPPRVLPKLDFKDGIPADCATIIVMPTMLVRPQSAAMLLERLEIHYLANPDPQFRFALLTDFADAPGRSMPEDEGYIAAALDGVKALNARYCSAGARTGSSSSIAGGSGTRSRDAGWAGSGSAASSRSSIA